MLASGIQDGSTSREEVLSFVGEVERKEVLHGGAREEGLSVTQILYYIGGAIVVVGIAVFVGQKWNELSSFFRIFMTLGSGIACFVAAALLSVDLRLGRLPDAFHLMAALLFPTGIFVTLNELGFRGGDWGPGLIFLSLAAAYALASVVYRRNLLFLFTIIFGTIATLLLTDAMVAGEPIFDGGRYAAYRILGIGLSYCVFAYAWRDTPRRELSGVLYGFGSLGVLASALALGGWKPDAYLAWEITYPGLAFGAMFLSLWLRSRSMLVFGAIAVMAYIGKITAEYFADSLNWPLMLILAGFVLIGMGYLTYHLNRKYLGGGR